MLRLGRGVKNLDRSDLDKTKYKSHLPGRNKQCDFSRLSEGSNFRLRIRAKAQAFQFLQSSYVKYLL